MLRLSPGNPHPLSIVDQMENLEKTNAGLASSGQNVQSKKVYSASSIEVAALLTLSGGFLDVFTYIGHGKVFANTMTGNVIFLGMYAVTGQWQQTIQYILPIIAFMLGIFVAYHMQLPVVRKHFPKPALTSLGLEMMVLMTITFLPKSFPDSLLVLFISFVATLQNSSFNKLEDWNYNSVMTTGNLRRFAEALLSGIVPPGNPNAFREARLFGLLCLCFLLGAIIASLTTERLQNYALLVPLTVISSAFLICWRRQNATFLNFIYHK